MIPTLRKRHRQIWLVLAIILPLLFVAAVLVIPRPVYQEKLYQQPAKETSAEPNQEKRNTQ
jgi:flagellar basal body-associated protein FliL